MFDWLAVIQRRGLASGLVLHVAINYKEDELTIFCLVFVFFKRTDARAARVKVLALFFFFFFLNMIYLCAAFFYVVHLICIRHIFTSSTLPYTLKEKKKNTFSCFYFIYFLWTFYCSSVFFRTDFISIKPIRCWPAFGMHIYTYNTEREREAKQLTIYYIYIFYVALERQEQQQSLDWAACV